jgi:UPF0755 protein
MARPEHAVKRLLLGALLVLVLLAAGAAFLGWRTLHDFAGTAYGDADEKTVVVPPGASARAVVRLLAQSGVLAEDARAWAYFRVLKRDRRPFRAGEYAFQGALTPDQVFERVFEGQVKLHRFTVPEGLRMEEIAEIVGRSGLARAADLLAIARDPAVARALGVPFESLEGFLYPDTYSFPRGISARGIVDAMVDRFKDEYARADAARKPGVAFTMGEAATFASIVEKETGRPEERARIACVFRNRLRIGMRLQTDPTVMYATLLRTGRWSRNITRADLTAPHPYNTYTTGGLPPGPIANPGGAALHATLAPDDCADLYFVSRNDGTHVFCPDLACHNAAVRAWQVEFFRRKR